MIIFVTDQPQHDTDRLIIDTFNQKEVKFLVISPELPDEELIEFFQNNKDALVLLKPNHWKIRKICEILLELNITSINSSEVTKSFRSRWDVENALKIVYDEEISEKIRDKIRIPKSWYVLSEPDLSESEKMDFYKQFSETLKGKFPLIVKFPVNHVGFHFVKIVRDFNEIICLDNLIMRSGLIFQEQIKSTGEIHKCYYYGGDIFTQTQYEELGYLNLEDITSMEKILENNLHEISDADRKSRIQVETPEILTEFMQLIHKRFGIDLFGIDFIKISENIYYVIDINDFPGCRGNINIGKHIAEFVIENYERMNKKA